MLLEPLLYSRSYLVAATHALGCVCAHVCVGMGIISLPGVYKWACLNRRNLSMLALTVTTGVASFAALRLIPGGHVGLVVDRMGKVEPYVFESKQLVMIIPFWQTIVSMRTMPVRKRFIKEFTTKDNQQVEIRLVVSMEAKMHYLPETFTKFGKDFSRSFLEREASIDCEEVIKKFNAKDLLVDGTKYEEACTELATRLDDAAAFHKLKIVKGETSIVFVDPNLDEDEF